MRAMISSSARSPAVSGCRFPIDLQCGRRPVRPSWARPRAGYEVRGVQDLGGGRDVVGQFEVRIGGVSLTDVRDLADVGEPDVIEGTVPADLPLGVHDVEVRDPYGRRGTLPAAFNESDHSPPALSATLTAPARVEVGLPFTSTATIANTGGTDARIAALDLSGIDGGAAGVAVPAGGSVTLDIASMIAARGPATLQLH